MYHGGVCLRENMTAAPVPVVRDKKGGRRLLERYTFGTISFSRGQRKEGKVFRTLEEGASYAMARWAVIFARQHFFHSRFFFRLEMADLDHNFRGELELDILRLYHPELFSGTVNCEVYRLLVLRNRFVFAVSFAELLRRTSRIFFVAPGGFLGIYFHGGFVDAGFKSRSSFSSSADAPAAKKIPQPRFHLSRFDDFWPF